MERSLKLQDVEGARERLSEARRVLHLVEEKLGSKGNTTAGFIPPRAGVLPDSPTGWCVEMDSRLTAERKSSENMKSPEATDCTLLRTSLTLTPEQRTSRRLLFDSGVLLETTNLPRPDATKPKGQTDDLSGHLPEPQTVRYWETRGSLGRCPGRRSRSPGGGAISPSSGSQERRRQLLRVGSPPGRAIEHLRERIWQQKQDRQAGGVTDSPLRTTHVSQRGPVVRKVRRVSFATPPPAYRGFSIVGDKANRPAGPAVRTAARTQAKEEGTARGALGAGVRGKKASTSPPAARVGAAKPGGRSPGVSAWREAQRLVRQVLGPRPRLLTSPAQNTTPGTGDSQLKSDRALGLEAPSEARLGTSRGTSNSSHSTSLKSRTRRGLFPSKDNPTSDRSSPASKRHSALRGPSPSSPQIRTSPNQPINGHSLSPSHRNPLFPVRSPASPQNKPPPLASRSSRKASGQGEKEQVGSQRPSVPQSQSADDVRAFMGRRESERRRKARQEKQAALRQEEERKGRVQEVLRKQQTARKKVKVSPRSGPVPEGRRGAKPLEGPPLSLSPGATETKVSAETRATAPGPANQKRGVGGVAERVEALRRAAAALGARVEQEAARLGATGSPTVSPAAGRSRSTGRDSGAAGKEARAAGAPEEWDSTSISEELPWTGEVSEPRGARPAGVLKQTRLRARETEAGSGDKSTGYESRGQRRGEAGTGDGTQPAVTLSSWARSPGPLRRAPASVGGDARGPEKRAQPGTRMSPSEGRVSPESENSGSEANTNSTSRWSELSQFYGRGDMLSRLSLELSRQSLRDEELRGRQHRALFRLREEALREKTQAELAWLEHQRRSLRPGEDVALLDITKRQEEVLNRLQQEQAEIRHLHNVYKAARQQRKLLLRHQREILGIKRAAAHIHSDLQSWCTPEGHGTQGRLRDGPLLLPTAWGEAGNSAVGDPNPGRWQHLRQGHGSSPLTPHADPGRSKPALHSRGRHSEDRASRTSHLDPKVKNIRVDREGQEGNAAQQHTKTHPSPKGLADNTLSQTQRASKEDIDQLPLQVNSQEDATLAQLHISPQEVIGTHQFPGAAGRDVTLRSPNRDAQEDTNADAFEGDGPGLRQESRADHTLNQNPRGAEDQDPTMTSPDSGAREVWPGSGEERPVSAGVSQEGPERPEGSLFKKPDGGLRGLLPSEESWSWEKRRDDPEICTRAMEPSETTAISSLGSKVANRPHLLRSQHAADPDDRVPEQQDNSKGPTDRRSGCVAQGGPVRGDLNTDSKAVNPLLSGTQEGSGSMEINMEISEEESLSSRAITKQPLSPTSNDASWKSQKSAGSFPSLAEFQRVSAIRIHISDVSLSSTEIEEDLPFDSESSKWESTDNGGQWGQDVDSPSPGKLSTTSPVCPKESHRAVARLPEETVRHNDQNNQKSQSVFSVNNNHEKKQTSAVAGAEDHQRPSPQACQSISKPLFPTGSFSIRPVASVKEAAIDSLSRSAVSRTKDNSRRCPSSSGEESSDSEDKSAVLSLGSDIQVSSEEEQVPGTGVKKGPAKNDRSLQVSVHERTPGLPSCPDKTHSMESETTQVVGTCPELGSSASEKWMLRKEIIFTRKVEALMTASLASEETLSEILSPVDEVLSYGSAELPPSLAGGLFASLPSPPPAHEIITWTSEDFPPPPEGVVQSQEEEDSLEDDRSIKSEDLPSLTEDLPLPIDECDGAEMMNLTSAGEAPGSLQRKTVAMDSDGITVDPLKTSELPPSPLPNILLAEQEQDTNKDNKSQPFLTLSVVDDSDDSSDPLASFDIGDRVLVFHTKPGTLKFKGLTSFAGGHWAGVALDSPNGHHNGTFKGIQYFECEKNRGVLVRAEDISHLLGEQDSDLDTKANEDPFSDEDPPKNLKSKQEGQKETKSSERSSKGNASERQDHRGHRSISPRMCKNRLSLEEINNNSFHNTCGIMEEVLISEASLSTSESSLMTTNLEEIIYEAARAVEQFARSDSTLDLSLGLDDTDDAADIVYQPSVPSSESLRRESDAEEPKPTQLTYFRQDLDGIPLIGFDKAEEGDAQSIQSGSMNVQSAHSSQQVEKVPSTNGHGYDLELLIDRMAGELLNEVVRDVEKLRKIKQDSRGTVKEDTHSTGPGSTVPGKKDENQMKVNQLCFRDQWHCTVSPGPPPETTVHPHDLEMVRKLVGATVEQLWTQAMGQEQTVCQFPDGCEGPTSLVNIESRRTYRQVIFDLTADIFREAFQQDLKSSLLPWQGTGGSLLSAHLSKQTSLAEVKHMIQSEVQRSLNLDHSDLEMKRMLQTMSKFEKVQRDKVDLILIQELHQEEPQWVDYSAEELGLKMHLTEQIFDSLLQDTVSVLNRIYRASPPISPAGPVDSARPGAS